MDWSPMRWSLLILALATAHQAGALGEECCADGLVIVRGGCNVHGISSRNATAPAPVRYTIQCEQGMFMLDPNTSEMDKFHVADNGVLVVGDAESHFEVPQDRYCLGDWSRDGKTALTRVAMICISEESHEGKLYFVVKGACVVISVIFLIMTVICYVLLPELRDLQGKCVMCAVICLAVGFFCLGLLQLGGIGNLGGTSCTTFAMMVYLSMLAFFFWLNVVSFNLWRSVMSRTRRCEDSHLFRCYSAYAWGCPLVLAGIMLILQYGPPGFKIMAHESCFLAPGWKFMMFYMVIGIILLANTIMYSVTCWTLWRGMDNVVDAKRRSMKYKCCMYLKLFLLSGLTWIFEILSFIIETPDEWWLLTDVVNGLQGLVIFLVLIALRPRALHALAGRGLLCLRLPQRWRLRPDTELLDEQELDDDDADLHDETARTIDARNGR